MNPLERLEEDIKKLIIDTLALEDLTPADIDPTEPLFVSGLGLDSIDALEIGIALEHAYKVKMEGDDEQNRQRYRSVRSLAHWVSETQSR
jgi:acyl carrier protein